MGHNLIQTTQKCLHTPDADQRNLDAIRRIAQAPDSERRCQHIRLRDPLILRGGRQKFAATYGLMV